MEFKRHLTLLKKIFFNGNPSKIAQRVDVRAYQKALSVVVLYWQNNNYILNNLKIFIIIL